MPEKFLLNQDMHIPFMIGMVARTKDFIVDKGMVMLITSLITFSAAGGVAIHKLNQADKNIAILLSKQEDMFKIINEQNVKIAKMSVEITHLKNSMHGLVQLIP